MKMRILTANLQRFFLSFESNVEKELCRSVTNFKFALLLTTCPSIRNSRLPAAPLAITQNVFLAGSLRVGNSSLWFRHHWRMSLRPTPLYRPARIALRVPSTRARR